MGPSKFVAPLKRNNGLSSLSSAFSSSSSSGAIGNQDVAERAELQIQPEEDKAASSSGFKAPNETIKSDTSGLKQVESNRNGNSKILKKSEEPPRKKMKTVFAPLSHNVKSDNNLPNDDKENVCPATASKSKKQLNAKPCTSLTDEQYELIFDAVLRTINADEQSDDLADKPTVKSNALDHSKDLFEFSQSDLEDSEGEQSKSTSKQDTSVQGKDGALLLKNSSNADCDIVGSNEPTISGKSSNDKTIMAAFDTNPENIKESDLDSEIPDNEDLIDTNKENGTSQTVEADSQGSNAIDFENAHTSTPRVEKGSQQSNSDTFVTPQRTNYSQKVLGVSQEENRSPASTVMKVTVPPASQLSQVLEAGPSPNKTSSSTPGSQAKQVVPSLTCTPNQSTHLKTLHSSQGPNTPTCTPSSKLITKSQNPELLLQTPIKQSQVIMEAGSSVPSTPSGSQQISQEICLTPPPSEITAKERLLWLQKKRLAGLWVQCDKRECQKWRYLQDSHDPSILSDKWFCHMHPDVEFNSCDAPEKRLSLHAEEDMIYNKYSPGSLVWAKLSGYPWWPAMVEDDPDLEQFYWLNEFSDIPTWYHVVFFDEGERSSCCRAWVQVERLKDFQEEPLDNESPELFGYKKRVKSAHKVACQAKPLSLEQRLAQFSFASSYKGPIGGFLSRKYNGPVGFRELVTK